MRSVTSLYDHDHEVYRLCTSACNLLETAEANSGVLLTNSTSLLTGAIMFGDSLLPGECLQLLKHLQRTHLPFQVRLAQDAPCFRPQPPRAREQKGLVAVEVRFFRCQRSSLRTDPDAEGGLVKDFRFSEMLSSMRLARVASLL